MESVDKILNDSSAREIIFSFICEYGFPSQFAPATVQRLAQAALTFTDSEGDVAWHVVCAAIEYATLSRNQNLSESLLQSIRSFSVPEWVVVECAHIFCGMHCTGLVHTPELKPWIQLFHQQGTNEVFSIIHAELLCRLNRGELSSYEHLVATLCEADKSIALPLVRDIIKKLRVAPPSSNSLSSLASESLAMGIRLIPLSAILVMVFAGPEHTFSPTTLATSAILGSSVILCREILRGQTLRQNQKREAPAYSYITFAEKALKTIESRGAPSSESQDVAQELRDILARAWDQTKNTTP